LPLDQTQQPLTAEQLPQQSSTLVFPVAQKVTRAILVRLAQLAQRVPQAQMAQTARTGQMALTLSGTLLEHTVAALHTLLAMWQHMTVARGTALMPMEETLGTLQ
jgi:hypothetical protein